MIFVTLGTQKFQLNRLLKQLDKYIEQGQITDKVIAQIGYSDYLPKRYEYIDFLNKGLKVMDSTATSLCMDNDIPLIVFDMMTPGNMKKALMGEPIGTYVGRE